MANHDGWSSIEKLKGNENYHIWSFAITNLLDLNGLDKCILPEDNADFEKDKDKLKKAKARIALSVHPSIYPHIQKIQTPSVMWAKLKSLYEDSGLIRRIGLLRKLTTIRLETSNSMQDYVNQIIDCANKLNGIGFVVDDEWLGSILLAGLTNDYKPMIMGLESSGIAITADSVKSKLLDSSAETTCESAFFTKNRNGKNKFKGKCFECKNKNHMANQCKNKSKQFDHGNAKENKQSQSAKSAFMVGALNAVYLSHNSNKHEWFIDSGASQHMTPYDDLFQNQQSTSVSEIITANSEKVPVKSAGEINVNVNDREINIKNVLLVPKLSANLLSVSEMVSNGNELVFNKNGCAVYDDKRKCIANAKSVNGVYKLQMHPATCLKTSTITSAMTWHRRLGHINFGDLCKMRNGLVSGIEFNERDEADIKNCEICKEGKQTRTPFKRSHTRAKEVLELVHSDLCGPMENESIGGARYFLVFVDDHSRKIFVYFLKQKSEVLSYFIEFRSMVEKQTGKKLKILRTDNGGEYVNSSMKNEMKKHGIQHQKSVVYSPQQNGVAERANRKLVEKAKCMLFDANLGKEYWAEAINMASYLLNISANAVLVTITPEELWSNKKVDLSSDLKIFGSQVMMHIPEQKRQKWDKKSKKMLFVGYSDGVKGYRCIDPVSKKFSLSRDVFFKENVLQNVVNLSEEEVINDQVIIDDESQNNTIAEIPDQVIDNIMATNNDDIEFNNDNDDQTLTEILTDDSVYESLDDTIETIQNNDDEISDPTFKPDIPIESQIMRRSTRPAKPKLDEDYLSYAVFENCDSTIEPETLSEALNSHDSDQWKAAMSDEFNSLHKNQTWELVDLPHGRKAIKTKWVFKFKKDSSNKIVRYKARLVAKGCSQQYGIDYQETYSPVVRYTSIRYLMALAVKNDMNIDQMDAVTAFLQGDLSEDIYMQQPESFNDGSGRVCRLKKSYLRVETKQSCMEQKIGREIKIIWSKTFTSRSLYIL